MVPTFQSPPRLSCGCPGAARRRSASPPGSVTAAPRTARSSCCPPPRCAPPASAASGWLLCPNGTRRRCSSWLTAGVARLWDCCQPTIPPASGARVGCGGGLRVPSGVGGGRGRPPIAPEESGGGRRAGRPAGEGCQGRGPDWAPVGAVGCPASTSAGELYLVQPVADRPPLRTHQRCSAPLASPSRDLRLATLPPKAVQKAM